MFFLNLTLGQFLVLFGATSAIVVALYLLDRARRRQKVATLRFWRPAEQPSESRHRRRIQQPLSLLLQVLSMALLLLAIAQLRIGGRGPVSRDHILILDTSAWMAARNGSVTLMDQARALARAYVRRLPPRDRVMLVRGDALASPATFFETDRQAVEKAIDQSRPGGTAFHLEQALQLAGRIERLRSKSYGEIAVVTPGRIAGEASSRQLALPPNLRVLPVEANIENCGLQKIGLRQSYTEPDVWEVFASVHNYGAKARQARLAVQFGGAIVGTQSLRLTPGADQSATFRFRTHASGVLEARLLPADNFPQDDSATLEVPDRHPLRALVLSDSPEQLRPVLSANPQVEAVFRKPGQYAGNEKADIVILDRCVPPVPVQSNSIWIEPPPAESPIPVRSVLKNVKLERWTSGHPLATGLRTKDVILESAEVYRTAPDDIAVAEVDGGAVIVARPGIRRIVVLGFHPVRSGMRYELATPLLFANIFRWMAPEIFLRWDVNAGSVGSVNETLETEPEPSRIQVLEEDGKRLPFTVKARTVHFFAGTRGTYRMLTGDHESVYSLTLPEVGVAAWKAPGSVPRGLPSMASSFAAPTEAWPFLALSGGLGLALEWWLFGRRRRPRQLPVSLRARGAANAGARIRNLLASYRRRAS